MLKNLVSTIITYLNAGGYYKDADEIKNAINVAQLELYKKLRGNLADYGPSRPKSLINFQETSVSADSLNEFYRQAYVQNNNNGTVMVMPTDTSHIIDIIQSLEIAYSLGGDFYPVNIVPDNQFLMMANNSVIYPKTLVDNPRPLGRMVQPYIVPATSIIFPQFQIVPGVFAEQRARALFLPRNVDFTFTDDPISSVPIINVIVDTDFTDEKLNNLLYLTVANLGFNLSNGVLVQAGTAKEFKEL
jgi:hypothetical protein